MGARGPAPKRTDQRRRRNKSTSTKAPAGKHEGRPPTNGQWHPVAKRWYNSLGDSGQVIFYEASDWALAYLIAESISRELKPRKIFNEAGDLVAEVLLPPKGAALAAWLKAMTMLLVTETDRRRLGIELQQPGGGDDGEGGADVSWLDDARNRFSSPG